MSKPEVETGFDALETLEEVPGIADIVWAALARPPTDRDPRRLVFVSPEARAGTTLIAAATAVGLARHQRAPVCLVEANTAEPALAAYLGLHPKGLTDMLDGHADLEECLQELDGCPGLFVLPAGTPRPPVPGEFTTERMRSILERVGQRGRYLLLDAPPLLDHLESRLLLQHADGVLLVLRARSTRREAAARAHRILLESGAPLLGTILNADRGE